MRISDWSSDVCSSDLIEGLGNAEWRSIESPFGAPSDALLCGELDGQRLVFLPRHGRGHKLPPSALNSRANIDALKRAGVTEIVSLSAVGSLREDLAPGTFVVVDQFIDRSEEHTSELQSLMRISYAVFCLKKKQHTN